MYYYSRKFRAALYCIAIHNSWRSARVVLRTGLFPQELRTDARVRKFSGFFEFSISTSAYCTVQRTRKFEKIILNNILRSSCVAGIKILTNGFGPELNSAPNPFFPIFEYSVFEKIYLKSL